jgi:hypothetical protein
MLECKKYKQKKAQSIALNTIIIAAIALGVLIITFFIFTNQASSSTKTLQSCELKGGKCAESFPAKSRIQDASKIECNDNEYKVPIYISDPACGKSKLCCIKIT